MWVGAERNTLCASANEESDSLVNNALSHCCEWVFSSSPAKSEKRWKSKMVVALDSTASAHESLRTPASPIMGLWTEMSWNTLASLPMNTCLQQYFRATEQAKTVTAASTARGCNFYLWPERPRDEPTGPPKLLKFFDDYHFSETTEIFIQESSSDTRPAVTTPSAERSLHHYSLRNEKIQRAVDKLTTLLKKVCCQVSRCL